MRLFSRRRHCSSAARGEKSRLRVQVEPLEGRALLSLTPIDFAGTVTGTPVAVGGYAFFAASDSAHGNELWKSDGTTATLVKDINPGTGPSSPCYLTAVGNTLFFQANDGAHGPELWKSDGTAAGTVMVKDIYPGAVGSYPQDLVNVNGTLFFKAYDPVGRYELFRSDGTDAGTYMVKDICPGGSGNPYNLTAVGSAVYFVANDGVTGPELWKSDGTAAGTVLVKDINPGIAGSFPGGLVDVSGTLFFTANDGTDGYELWKSDGTAAGTVLVKDINPGPGSSTPSYLTDVNGTLFFAADDGTHGYELWKSDGTAAGTAMVKDIDPGSIGSMPNHLTAVGSTLFFTADDGVNGTQLWKSDGTTGGTVMVADINPGGSSPSNLTNVNGMLCFAATSSTCGNELWESDGTPGGTTQVADIDPGAPSSNPTNLVAVGSTLFFTATDASHPTRLWTDTLTAGSSLPEVSVGSILPNSAYGQSVGFTVTVSGGGPTPTGTVQFRVDGTDFGTAVPLSGGSATSPSTTLLGASHHTIEADYSGDSSYSVNSSTYIQVVSKAPLSIVPDNHSRAVGQPNPTLTYTFTGFVNGENATSARIAGTANLATAATTGSPEGTYPITVTDAGTLTAANYNFPSADFATGTLTVTPFAARLAMVSTLPGSTYGQSVDFTVTVGGNGPTPTGTVQFRVDGTDFGTSVPLSGGSAASPSTTLLGAGNHTIEAYYSGDSNYSANSDSLIQAVSKAHLTVAADANTRPYGQANPALTATLSGFVNGDTAAVVSGGPSLSTTATAGSGVGSYPISVAAGTLSAANYDFPNLVNGALTIAPAPLTIIVDPKTRGYGQANPALTGTVIGILNGDAITVTYTTAATAASEVVAGGYPITVGSLAGPKAMDYSLTVAGAGITPAVLMVTPAPLTMTADPQTRMVGQPNPPLTASYSGFVNGDDPTRLTGLPTLSTTATVSSPAGTYSITIDGASSPNYTITYVEGKLNVIPGPVVVPPVTVTSLKLATIKVKVGTGKRARTTTQQVLQVQYSGPLDDAGNLAAYHLLAGRTSRMKGKLATAFIKPVPLSSASYSPSANTVTLIPRGKLNLAQPEQLRVTASLLKDASGRPLDGDHDGQPGGDFVGIVKR
jgi:ELWxxDGT repeat protein